MSASTLIQDIEMALGRDVIDLRPLTGGCVGQVYRADLQDRLRVVAKVDDSDNPRLHIEGYMLRFLAEKSELPVPEVWFSTPRLLLMSFIDGNSSFSKPTQEHAAELLAGLHQIQGPAYGFEKDTLIGGLHQPNPWTNSWLAFFRDERLLHMGNECVRKGRFSNEFYGRLEKFTAKLDLWLHEPRYPALIHGDVWTSNVLALDDRITGFLDPAIYFAAPEVELAFTALFGTFGESFFARYQELAPLKPGFFEERKDIYNLYPLLVHVRLFGGSYINSVDHILRRYGY